MAEPKLAIIVGVGRGLGGAISRRFAAAGHPVAMAARTPANTQQIESEIESAGGVAKAFEVDARDEDSVGRFFDQAESEFGPVGVTVANIGGRPSSRPVMKVIDTSAAEMEETWRNGFMTAFHTAKEAARRMVLREEGSIFFTGAPSSRRGMASHSPFAVAKFGVRALAESMARELSPLGIHVAHFTLDGGVGNENRTTRDPELAASDGLMSIEALAEAYYQTHLQPRSCWSFDVEMRPWNRAF